MFFFLRCLVPRCRSEADAERWQIIWVYTRADLPAVGHLAARNHNRCQVSLRADAETGIFRGMAAPLTTTYTADERAVIATHIMREVAAGRSVTSILMHDDGMPDRTTFWDWMRTDEQLAQDVARARDHGIEARLEDAQAIVDGDDVVSLDGLSGDALARAMWRNNPKMQRLRYDARIKMAQMLKPKKYGPKLDLTTDGNALNKPPADDAEKVAEMLKRVEQRLDPKTQELLS